MLNRIFKSPFFCLALSAALLSSVVASVDYNGVVEEFGLTEVAATLDTSESKPLAFLTAVDALSDDWGSISEKLENDPIFKTAAIAEQIAAAEASSSSKALEEVLLHAMAEDINTGYNILPDDAYEGVDPARTIIYGHNRIKHVRQLLFLLRVHDLEPEFTIVPKRSAFKLREGWGNTTEDTPRLPDGTPVAIISEYDLVMEFGVAEEVLKFQELVTRYAKKDSDDEEGLIYRSWWQPFYRSFVPAGPMQQTREIWVSKDGFKANVLSIPEQAEEKEKQLRDLSDEWAVNVIDLWVNPSFYRYLLGDYK